MRRKLTPEEIAAIRPGKEVRWHKWEPKYHRVWTIERENRGMWVMNCTEVR